MNPYAQTILENNNYAVLSTICEDGTPWGTPVHIAFDEQSIYWISADDAIHSRNIERNSRVFLVVFDSQQDTARGERSALYVATTAWVLEGEEAHVAHAVYAGRFTTSQGVGEGAHIYGAPIGVLDEGKTKDKMLYFRGPVYGGKAL